MFQEEGGGKKGLSYFMGRGSFVRGEKRGRLERGGGGDEEKKYGRKGRRVCGSLNFYSFPVVYRKRGGRKSHALGGKPFRFGFEGDLP